MKLLRLQTLLGGLWAGITLAVGGIAAPSLFMALERQMAGKAAGQIFAVEARLSLALAVLIFVIERRRVRDLNEVGEPTSALTINLMLTLGALFLVIFGEFVLHPMIEAVKAGQPSALSFGALHGISASLYWLRAALELALAWRLTATASNRH
jgi:Domain of unknown function (DUF4149)